MTSLLVFTVQFLLMLHYVDYRLLGFLLMLLLNVLKDFNQLVSVLGDLLHVATDYRIC